MIQNTPAKRGETAVLESSLALVMTDLEDSTGGWDRNRKSMLELLQAYIELVERRLKPAPKIENFTGDGHLLSFPDVDSAATAALRLREQWDQRRHKMPREEVRETHRLKLAVHGGRVHRLEDGRILGNPINICARVLAAAAPGEVLVSESAVCDFDARDKFAWGEPRTVKLKGLHTVRKFAPETPLFPLLGLSGRSGEVPLPDTKVLRRRRIAQDIWDEITGRWGTEQENTEEELTLTRNLLELEPDNTGALQNLAAVLRRLGRTQEAEGIYRECLQKNPDCVISRTNLNYNMAGSGGR